MNNNFISTHSQGLRAPNPQLHLTSKILPPTHYQNLEESPAKILNSEDLHMITFSPTQESSQEETDQSIDRIKKKEANFKHLLNLHHISDIISGKRTRKAPDSVAPTKGNPQQNLPDTLRHKSKVIQKKRGRPPLIKKSINLPEPIKRHLTRTRGNSQNTQKSAHSNSMIHQVNTRGSKRSLPMVRTSIEAKAAPMKKIFGENKVTKINHHKEQLKKEVNEASESSEEEVVQKNGVKEVVEEEKVPHETKKNIIAKSPAGMTRSRRAKGAKMEALEQNGQEPIKYITRRAVEKEFSIENFLKTEEKIVLLKQEYTRPSTYINCDLRYFNFDFLVDKLGFFDVIIMDPPWRIKGAQQNDSSFMFSNSKFNLEYDTLSNQEIMNLKVERLSKKGFLFLWILSNQINTAYEMMNKWGYEVVDQIIWVKIKDSKIKLSHGYYFMHSFEMCLVGFKTPPGECIEYTTKLSNDVLFGEVRAKSQKPEELYELIDMIMPGSRKIELFARNHNLRPGWFSLGNQLGETFEKWYNIVKCNNCDQPIYIGLKRYKARHEPDFDLCEKCFVAMEKTTDDFFEMNNKVNEDVLHHYHSCNSCMTEPIWGTRFTCVDCENFDLCECCYDKNLRTENKIHDFYHNFQIVEVPILANGLPAHLDRKCVHCFQKPILGVCFICSQCPNLNFCQNCFFSKPHDEMKKFRGHKPHHEFMIRAEPVETESRLTKCSWCEICPITGTTYKCENCFSFHFCEKCYLKRDSFKPNTANTHKFYHTFTVLDGSDLLGI